jgi:hypothetical protein
MDRSNAGSMQQSLQQQLEQQRRSYEKLKADSSQRDREQQDQIQDLHLRVVNEQEEKVGGPLVIAVLCTPSAAGWLACCSLPGAQVAALCAAPMGWPVH